MGVTGRPFTRLCAWFQNPSVALRPSCVPAGPGLGVTWVRVFRACPGAPGRGRAGAQWAGPCVPRLAPLYQVLQPMAGCARVLQCAQAVPTLLQVFFSAVTQVSPLPRPRSHGRGPVASRTAALTMEELQLRGGGGEEERHLQPHPGPVPLAQPSLSPGWRRDSQDQGRGSRSRCSVAGLSLSLDPSSPTGL